MCEQQFDFVCAHAARIHRLRSSEELPQSLTNSLSLTQVYTHTLSLTHTHTHTHTHLFGVQKSKTSSVNDFALLSFLA